MKCKICGRRFRLEKQKKYLASEEVAFFDIFKKPIKTYECFDCPHCGCQHFVNVRLPDDTIEDEEKTEGERDNE